MGDDDSQKLLPWRGISLLSGAQTSGSQQNQHQHCTGKLGWISVGGKRLAQLHTAWIILGKYTWINSRKRRSRLWIDAQHPRLTIQQQCELLGLPRSTYYYEPRAEGAENLRLLRRLDELYLEYPFFGSRRMAVTLEVNRKRIQRLMRILRIEALSPKPNLSRPAAGHEIYPYLLRGVAIERPNQVWSTDITYVPMQGGFLYLVAVMDWFSRFVLSWELSNTMETGFCLAKLEAAFRFGQPEIWNSDQGSQFTSADFLAPLKKRSISISMDGRGRALDNVFIERLWRSLKYELIYPGDFGSGADLLPALDRYFHFYNHQRPHQALGYRTPAQLFPRQSIRKRAWL